MYPSLMQFYFVALFHISYDLANVMEGHWKCSCINRTSPSLFSSTMVDCDSIGQLNDRPVYPDLEIYMFSNRSFYISMRRSGWQEYSFASAIL